MVDNLKIALKKHQRLIALFLLTIFLPSALLSFFGIRAIRSEHFQLLRQVENEQDEIAALLQANVQSRVRAVEDLLHSLAREPSLLARTRSGARPLLLRALADEPLVELLFVIRDDAEPEYPLFRHAADEPTGRRGSTFSEEERREIAKAQNLEFQENKYGEAAAIYGRLAESSRDQGDRARFLAQCARNRSKLKQYRRAAALYARIVSEHPSSQTASGIPLPLIAHLELVSCYRMLGEPEKAVQSGLDVYGAIVNDTYGLDEDEFRAYASIAEASLRAVLDDTAAQVPGRQRDEEALADLKQAGQSRDATWKVISLLEQEALPDMKRRVAASAAYSSTPLRHRSTVDGRDLLLTAVMIPDEGARGTRGLLGVTLSHSYLEGALLDTLVAEAGTDHSTVVTVSNISGRVLYGGSATSDDRVRTTAYIQGNFPPWRIDLVDREVKRSGFPEIHRSFYFWTILTLMVVLVFGGVLVVRTVGHEMELLKVKSDFVSSVSHEFKTPLTSIKALTERLVEGKVRDPGKMKEYFSVILQDTGRLARLVGNLLDFSRIEEGRKEYEFAPTDMVEWLRQTVDDFRQETIGGTVEVRIHVAGEIPAISIDRAAMSQALSNLLDNAAKFSAEDRRVDLRVEHRDAKVIIAVQDHGIGIPEHERTKIFEKFHQGPAPPGKSARGTGLGLTLVKHTVEAHGGTITVESQMGRGSTFVVTLPVRGTPEEGAHG